ncbi:MAG: S-methyl-5-thioribose-1-phosphate isomerase [Vulcanimicrobiota bacterium]
MKTIEWCKSCVRILDQRKLPLSTEYLECKDYNEVASAIKTLAVRGAPAIGVAAAMAMVLSITDCQGEREHLLKKLEEARKTLAATRPTAVNLMWALDRIMKKAQQSKGSGEELKAVLMEEAALIADEDERMCRSIGEFGAKLIEDGNGVLTHCNAGSLATFGYGTALGVLRSAHRNGKKIHVYVDETRPLLQGARLTSWELKEEGIPFTLITDSMAGYFMKKGVIQRVIVGADRIAANGDAANKIGTYSVAVLAHAHSIPFYVAAPYSTVDFSIDNGDHIIIEERSHDEVTTMGGTRIAPPGIEVANPAFDVTPHRYISAIITDKGIIMPPFAKNLKEVLSQ